MKSKRSQEEINTAELVAWNEWKEVCSIGGCTAENWKVLAGRVKVAFERKLEHLGCGDCMPDDSAYEFDMGMAEKWRRLTRPESCSIHEFEMREVVEEDWKKAKKLFKDHIWFAFKKSKDSPLKIIRGKLTGKVGVINEIAERYLRENHHSVWEIHKKKRSYVSLDAPLPGSDGENADKKNDGKEERNLEDIVSVENDRSKNGDRPCNDCAGEIDRPEFQTFFLSRLSKQDVAVMLVYLAKKALQRKVSITDPELLAYTGFSKSTCCDHCNNIVVPRLREGQEILRASGSVDLLVSILKGYLEPEKSAAKLLLKIEGE